MKNKLRVVIASLGFGLALGAQAGNTLTPLQLCLGQCGAANLQCAIKNGSNNPICVEPYLACKKVCYATYE